MILIGELSLWIALVMAVWATGISYAGGALRRGDLIASGERGLYVAWGFTVLASAGLLTALVTHDVSFRYVASYTSANLPTLYTVAAFWAGQSGSLLFWALVLATYSAIALFTNRRANRELMPWVTGTLGVVLVFFLAVTAFGANPYERLDWIPPDGRGMNPELQHPGMAIHLPTLYLGYAATAVPFAFAIAALISRRLDAAWPDAVRRWALVSWFFLTVGIALRMWSAYAELGRGRYWAWDAVENASPWFAGLVALALVASVVLVSTRPVRRDRRRYGGYIVPAGMTLVFAASAGLAFRKEFDVTLKPGETFTAKDPYGHAWTFTSAGVSRFDVLNRQVLALSLTTTRDGKRDRLITTERRQYVDSRGNPTFEPSTEAGILEGARQDVYVVLGRVSPGEQAVVRITFNPLVMWMWIGAIVMALGGLVVMWPKATAAT